jgi:Protein of unknown function (DUF2568)
MNPLMLLRGANLALAFLLELCALGAFGYWGFKTGSTTFSKFGLGIGAPLLAAVVWGVFVAPRAAVPAPELLRFVIQVLFFGSAALGLATTGHRTLAGVFVAIVVVNAILAYMWGQ